MNNKTVDKKEYDELLEKYSKQEKRISTIIKMSDTQQAQVLKLNEQLEYALEKIKSYHYVTLSDEYYWNKDSRHLLKDDKVIDLSNYEILFLECLVNNLNHTVFYEDIHSYVYSLEEFSQGALTTMVKRIRQKTHKDIIKTSSKEGYKITI